MREPVFEQQVAVAILVRDGCVLVGRREPGRHLAGLHEFPGGKREPEEDIVRTLHREVAEEVGLDLVEARPLAPPVRHVYEDRTVVLFAFLCRADGDRPLPEGWRWVPMAELGGLEFPPASAPYLRFLAGPRARHG